jgi:7-cyano-7-deazaguanine synthase
MKKSEIIKKGLSLKVDYSLTHSCYNPDSTGRACGKCDSCILRKKGFSQAGVADPTPYSEENNCYRL